MDPVIIEHARPADAATRGGHRRRTIVVTVVAAGGLAALWRFLTFSGFSNDHYVHVARADELLRGEWPVRDFVDPGMPLTYVASALGRLLLGDALRSEFAVTAAGFAIGAAATAWCALRLTRTVLVTAVVVALQIAISPRTYSSPKMALYGLAGCAVVLIASAPTRARLAGTALLIALAFLIRHDHGVYIGFACVLALVARGAPLDALARQVVGLTAGAGLLLVPWALFVQRHGGLLPYFRLGLEFSRREADVSLLRFWPAFDTSLPLLAGPNVEAWLYYLFFALPWLCVIVVWRRRWRGRTSREETAVVTGLAVLAMAVNNGFIRDPLMGRLPDVIVPDGLLLGWALGLAWRRPIWTRLGAVAKRAVVTAALVVTAAAVWVVGDVRDHLDDVGLLDDWDAVRSNAGDIADELSHRQADVPRTPTRVSAALVPFFRYLDRCTTPADRLLVSGAYADVFVAADRGFAGGQVTYQEGFNTGSAAERLILERMQRQSVPFALLVSSADDVFQRDFSRVAGHVAESYRPLTEIPVPDEDPVQVLVERKRVQTRTDAATGWPCFR